jgi:chromosome condensin MukBEF ATPase and DNA-binding subunit MukB
MADHHPETALSLIKSWRVILNKETGALSQGNIQELERLFQKASEVQQRLSHMFAASNPLVKDKTISIMIRGLHKEQEKLIESLKAKTEELAQEIGTLRKSQASLKGYKQKNPTTPRYMNERT